MIYTIKRAKLIAEQLRKFSDSNSWMVVGQFVNLDFWMEEVYTALKAIDEHNLRFNKMYDAQKEWIDSHDIHVPDNCPICKGICELGSGSIKPSLPRRSAETKTDKKESRKELINATYYFLVRCYKVKLVSVEELKEYCASIGTSVDIDDL